MDPSNPEPSTPPPNVQAYAFFVLLAVYLLFTITCTILFIVRRNVEPIRSRYWGWALMSVYIAALNFVVGCISIQFAPFQTLSCHFQIWVYAVLLMPAWLQPYFFRAYLVYFNYEYNTAKITGGGYADRSWFHRYRWTTTNSFLQGIYICTIAFFLIIGVLIHFAVDAGNVAEPFVIGNSECLYSLKYLIVAEGFFNLGLMIVGIIFLWNVSDAFSLKKELQAVVIGVCIPLILWCIQSIGRIFPPSVNLKSEIWACIAIIWSTVVSLLAPFMATLPHRFRRSCLGRLLRRFDSELDTFTESLDSRSSFGGEERTIPVRRTSKLSRFERDLENPVMLDAFKQYCVEAWCAENILFFLDARHFHELPPDQQPAEANRLRRQYFTSDAPLELNLDEDIKNKVNEQINRGDISSSLFDASLDAIVHTMRQDTYAAFRHSDSYLTAVRAIRRGTTRDKATKQVDVEDQMVETIP